MRFCDWCLNEHDDEDLHVVPGRTSDELDDLVCRFCDPNGGQGQ